MQNVFAHLTEDMDPWIYNKINWFNYWSSFVNSVIVNIVEEHLQIIYKVI